MISVVEKLDIRLSFSINAGADAAIIEKMLK